LHLLPAVCMFCRKQREREEGDKVSTHHIRREGRRQRQKQRQKAESREQRAERQRAERQRAEGREQRADRCCGEMTSNTNR